VLCGVKVSRGGWDGLPVLIDVCGYNLAERSERTGCVGRSEVFGWLRTGAHLLYIVRRSFDWYRCITDILHFFLIILICAIRKHCTKFPIS
jgi:hypothetical protein